MKCRNNEGFSLIEMLVAIVILGLITVPMTSGMVLAMKTIARSEKMMEAQLAVSSAVETLMATGMSEDTPIPDGVKVDKSDKDDSNNTLPYYNVTITSVDDETVYVTTAIRKVGGTE